MRYLSLLMFFLGVIATPLAHSQAGADDVLVENEWVKLTRGDYEAELTRVPADMRQSFATDPKRLTALLNNILIAKTLAAQARKQGLDREPATERRLALEGDRLLAAMQIERVEQNAARDFDAKQKDYLAKAREIYRVDRSKYVRPEQIVVSQIVFETANRGDDDALVRARDARAKLAAGSDFAEMAKAVSDDPASKLQGGRTPWLAAAEMDPAIAKAVFEMKKGDVSEPLHGRIGYYVIKLEDKRPSGQLAFDEVKDPIMAELRKRVVADARDERIAAIRNDPAMKINQVAVDALVVKTDPEILKRAMTPDSKNGALPSPK